MRRASSLLFLLLLAAGGCAAPVTVDFVNVRRTEVVEALRPLAEFYPEGSDIRMGETSDVVTFTLKGSYGITGERDVTRNYRFTVWDAGDKTVRVRCDAQFWGNPVFAESDERDAVHGLVWLYRSLKHARDNVACKNVPAAFDGVMLSQEDREFHPARIMRELRDRPNR
jgi:hypothetical protein